MSVHPKEPLRFSLAGRPLSPGDLVGVKLAKLHQAFGHRKHRDFVYRVESSPVAEQINRKQKETHAQGEGPIALPDTLHNGVRNHVRVVRERPDPGALTVPHSLDQIASASDVFVSGAMMAWLVCRCSRSLPIQNCVQYPLRQPWQ